MLPADVVEDKNGAEPDHSVRLTAPSTLSAGRLLGLRIQLTSEPSTGKPHISVNGCFRQIEDLGNLSVRQSPEVVELDHLAASRIVRLQTLQGFIKP
jgi:hypothetical protein